MRESERKKNKSGGDCGAGPERRRARCPDAASAGRTRRSPIGLAALVPSGENFGKWTPAAKKPVIPGYSVEVGKVGGAKEVNSLQCMQQVLHACCAGRRRSKLI